MSTRAQILAGITTQFPDNSTGFITPAKLRQVVEDIATSYNNSTDEGTPAAIVAAYTQPKEVDLFFIGGQSNAVGTGQAVYAPATDPTKCLLVNSAHAVVPIVEPLDGKGSGSMFSAFVSEYAQLTGRTVAVATAAVSGSSQSSLADAGYGNWDASGTLYGFGVTHWNASIAALESAGWKVNVRGLLWSQGEADAVALGGGYTAAQYRSAFEAMIARLRTEYGPDFRLYVVQTGTRTGTSDAPSAQIRAEQVAVSLSDSRVVLATRDAVDFPDLGWMWDTIHYSQTGLNFCGQRLAESAATGLPRSGEYFRWYDKSVGVDNLTSGALTATGVVRFTGLPSGILAADATGVLVNRTITGTTNQVTVTNGDGVSGNPTLALPQSIATSSAPQFANIGVGVSSTASASIRVGGTSSSSAGVSNEKQIQPSDTIYRGYSTYPSTATGAPVSSLIHFDASQGAIGAGSSISAQYGFRANSSMVGATNNYGFRGDLPSGTGLWNLYMVGQAQNYLAGSLGIGVSVPAAQLHTTGTVRFAAFGAGTLVTDSSGNVTVSSDLRLKNISGKFTRGLDAILQIQPKVFTWKPESGMNPYDANVGFIAQDVQDAIPEAVGSMKTVDTEEDDGTGKKVKSTKREASEFLTLSDRPIIAALVNAVKELKAENDALLARVSALENGKAAPFTTTP